MAMPARKIKPLIRDGMNRADPSAAMIDLPPSRAFRKRPPRDLVGLKGALLKAARDLPPERNFHLGVHDEIPSRVT
jgi:hypothetical protein